MRDFSAGWISLIDTRKKSGLSMITNYDDLRINYANIGNQSNELMFNTTYLPRGQSRTYTVQLLPVVGIDRLLYTDAQLTVGYAMQTDNKGGGKVDFTVERSAQPVNTLTLDVAIAGATGGSAVPVGNVTFDALERPAADEITHLHQCPA